MMTTTSLENVSSELSLYNRFILIRILLHK